MLSPLFIGIPLDHFFTPHFFVVFFCGFSFPTFAPIILKIIHNEHRKN